MKIRKSKHLVLPTIAICAIATGFAFNLAITSKSTQLPNTDEQTAIVSYFDSKSDEPYNDSFEAKLFGIPYRLEVKQGEKIYFVLDNTADKSLRETTKMLAYEFNDIFSVINPDYQIEVVNEEDFKKKPSRTFVTIGKQQLSDTKQGEAINGHCVAINRPYSLKNNNFPVKQNFITLSNQNGYSVYNTLAHELSHFFCGDDIYNNPQSTPSILNTNVVQDGFSYNDLVRITKHYLKNCSAEGLSKAYEYIMANYPPNQDPLINVNLKQRVTNYYLSNKKDEMVNVINAHNPSVNVDISDINSDLTNMSANYILTDLNSYIKAVALDEGTATCYPICDKTIFDVKSEINETAFSTYAVSINSPSYINIFVEAKGKLYFLECDNGSISLSGCFEKISNEQMAKLIDKNQDDANISYNKIKLELKNKTDLKLNK